MTQALSSLTRWVVGGVLAGLATSVVADDFLNARIGSFLDTNGTFSVIDVPGFFAGGGVRGINDAGQIVGNFQDSTGRQRGFLKVGSTFSTIDVPGALATRANGINDAGQIVGNFVDSNFEQRGFLKVGNTFSTFNSSVNGINDAGQIVGDFRGHGFLIEVDGTVSTIDVPGGVNTRAMGINDAGQIVGSFFQPGVRDRGFLYSGGTFSTFDFPGADHGNARTNANGINDAGQVVGTFVTDFHGSSGGQHGFLKTGSTFSTIDVPGTELMGTTIATGINDAGQIVGVFMLPEPGTLVLFSVGLLGLGLAWRHSRAAGVD